MPSRGFEAFVLMPFRRAHFGLFDRCIAAAVKDAGGKAKLAPDVRTSHDIMHNIFAGIWESRVVIADLTNANPNVMYEVGIARALNKPLIALTQSVKDVPFDLRRDVMLEYRNTKAGRDKLLQTLAEELRLAVKGDWISVPPWRGELKMNLLPVPALLAHEAGVESEVWIIEPEESFQDELFYGVIIGNLQRGVSYKFIVLERRDIERAFKRTLGRHYGKSAQVLYVKERSLQLPFSLAMFEPGSPRERAFQYFPNGQTIYGVEMARSHATRARQLFMALWMNRSYRVAGNRSLRSDRSPGR